MQAPYTFFFAFVVVLALIGLAAWLVRRFGGNRLGGNASRGRMPRLAVIDAAAVDGRRRLVLVRRDNVEHLLMIGGPTDIVVEQNIVRAIPGRDQAPSRSSVSNDAPRMPPASDPANWADSDGADHAEPHLPEPPPRAARPSFGEEPRRSMPSLPDRRQDPASGFMPEPRLDTRSEPLPPRAMPRSESPMPRSEPAMPRNEPMMPRPTRPEPFRPPVRPPERATPVVPPAPVAPPATIPAVAPASSADQNLADMAQRLEAALRRPTNVESSEPRIGAPPVAPEPPSRPARSSEISVTPPSRSEPSLAPPVAPPAAKTGFENLEDEMASLLGRPKNLS
ncbi:flagellar biosynthetic protein FliO [soil metagenome]